MHKPHRKTRALASPWGQGGPPDPPVPSASLPSGSSVSEGPPRLSVLPAPSAPRRGPPWGPPSRRGRISLLGGGVLQGCSHPRNLSSSQPGGPCSGQLSVYPSLVPRAPTQPPKPINKLSVRSSSPWVRTLPWACIPHPGDEPSYPQPACGACVTSWSSLAPDGSAFAGCCSCYEARGSEPE